MGLAEIVQHSLARGMPLARATVAAVTPDGRVRVRAAGAAGEPECDVLATPGEAAPAYAAGDEVLAALPARSGERGVVLGRVGPQAAPARAAGETRLRDRRVVVEAGEELTLQCGEASIRITRDGKVVVRGEHVLTRARGTNRIKGGSVAIN